MAFKTIISAFCACIALISFNVNAAFVETHALASTGQTIYDIQKDATHPIYVAVDTVINPNRPSSQGTSQASASADLRTGEIKAYINATDASGTAWAKISDSLTIHLPASLTSVDIGVYFTINGLITRSSNVATVAFGTPFSLRPHVRLTIN